MSGVVIAIIRHLANGLLYLELKALSSQILGVEWGGDE